MTTTTLVPAAPAGPDGAGPFSTGPDGAPLLVSAVRSALAAADPTGTTHRVLVPAPTDLAARAADLLRAAGLGAATVLPQPAGHPQHRPACLAAGLRALSAAPDTLVLVQPLHHPATPPGLAAAALAAVRAGAPAAVPVGPVTDTLKQLAPDGSVQATVARDGLRALQAPYAFTVAVAYQLLGAGTHPDHDEIEHALTAGVPVALVPGVDRLESVHLATVLPPGTARRPARPVRAAAVVLAGGSGTRFGASGNKAFLPLAGEPVAVWSLRALAATESVRQLTFVTRPADLGYAAELLATHLPGLQVDLVAGGASRHGSEYNALDQLAPMVDRGELDLVLLHDAARPVVRPELVDRLLRAAAEHGGALPGLPVHRLVSPDPVRPRPGLVSVQTPQAFRAAELLAAHRAAAVDGFEATDTSGCVERYAPGLRVRCVPGDPDNLKVTYRPDLPLAERLLAGPA